MLNANPNQDIPAPDGVERPNAKVQKIVDDIMQLNIFESIQLSKSLQVSSQRRRTGGTAAAARFRGAGPLWRHALGCGHGRLRACAFSHAHCLTDE